MLLETWLFLAVLPFSLSLKVPINANSVGIRNKIGVCRPYDNASKWHLPQCLPLGMTVPKNTNRYGIRGLYPDIYGFRTQKTRLSNMGHVSGAYVELLERGKNSVAGIFQHSSFPHFIAGLVAGIFECLVGHPLDTIRIGVMTSSDQTTGLLAILKQLALAFSSPKRIIDIYRGVNSEMLSAALGGAILFGVNELLKETLNDIDARRKARLEAETKVML